MDFGRAFSYVFEDERWLSKVAIGGLVTLVPILNFAALGYMLRVAENVARGNPHPLPEWNEFGDHFMHGLYAFVITLVYFIPYILVAIVFSFIAAAAGAASNSDGAQAAAGLFSCLLVPVYLVVAFACMLFAYAGLARYVATHTLSEAFKFGEVFAMVRNRPGPWLMLLLAILLAGIVGSLGLIACGIGVIFTAFYAYLVMGHALGQTVAQQGLIGSAYTTMPPGYGPPPSYQ